MPEITPRLGAAGQSFSEVLWMWQRPNPQPLHQSSLNVETTAIRLPVRMQRLDCTLKQDETANGTWPIPPESARETSQAGLTAYPPNGRSQRETLTQPCHFRAASSLLRYRSLGKAQKPVLDVTFGFHRNCSRQML